MLEADGTTFRFYGLVPATGTINFPAVDTYARFHVPSCVQRGEEGRRSFPFLSFPREGDSHASMASDVWSGYVTGLLVERYSSRDNQRWIRISGEYKWMERREIEFERISLRIVGMARR